MTAPEGHGLADYKFTEVSLVRFALKQTIFQQGAWHLFRLSLAPVTVELGIFLKNSFMST